VLAKSKMTQLYIKNNIFIYLFALANKITKSERQILLVKYYMNETEQEPVSAVSYATWYTLVQRTLHTFKAKNDKRQNLNERPGTNRFYL
jgi:hypothetical protein